MSPVHRIHKSETFAQIPNDTLRDARLSYRARGILAMVLTHSDHWEVDKDFIESQGTEGDVAITSAFRELETLGYRRVVRSRDEQGRLTTQVHWYETPPGPEKSGPGDSGDLRTPSKNTKNLLPPPVDPSPTGGSRGDTVTPGESHGRSSGATPPEGEESERAFERFWTTYPRCERVRVTRAAWDAALRKASAEEIITAAARYAALCEGRGGEFVSPAVTWLNDERWRDRLPEPPVRFVTREERMHSEPPVDRRER